MAASGIEKNAKTFFGCQNKTSKDVLVFCFRAVVFGKFWAVTDRGLINLPKTSKLRDIL